MVFFVSFDVGLIVGVVYVKQKMVYKCSAYGCRTGYDTTTNECKEGSDRSISMHRYPIDNKELCAKWIKANPRDGFVPTKYSKICAIHFNENDFTYESTDSNSRRVNKLRISGIETNIKKLKPDAVPSIFPNAPQYLSKTTTPRSTKKSTTEQRITSANSRINELIDQMDDMENIENTNIYDVKQKLEQEILPSGFCLNIVDNVLLILFIKVDEFCPSIKGCIKIKDDKSFEMYIFNNVVSLSKYKDIVKNNIKKISDVTNLMSRMKFWIDDDQSIAEVKFNNVISNLKYITDSENDFNKTKLKFITEQLMLMKVKKHGQHYSPELMVTSFLIYSHSRSAYTFLKDESILTLPSISTLKKVTKSLNNSKGLSNENYLKMRFSQLNEYERNIILIIDEMYVSRKVEYSAGEFTGMSSDGNVASTMLCFMIRSVVGKYRDLVAIYPMAHLTANKQLMCHREVCNIIQSTGFNLTLISVDNASTNRKFYKDLCKGKIENSYINEVTGKPVYLIFDPVHNFKNLYNNFQKRKIFKIPLNNDKIIQPSFVHIEKLFDLEKQMTMRKAFKLTETSIRPNNIDRLSTKHASAIFSETTRDALIYYSSSNPSWKDTAEFLTIIIEMWNIINVKNPSKGYHKRCCYMDPIKNSSDWKLTKLEEFYNLIDKWESSGNMGLTKETFSAVKQTSSAMIQCCKYLIDNLGFNYILLGNIQSDTIESRYVI